MKKIFSKKAQPFLSLQQRRALGNDLLTLIDLFYVPSNVKKTAEDHQYFLESARSLIERGAKIDVVDKDGKTALHLCIEKGDVEDLKVLLPYFKDRLLNVPDRLKGQTPLMYAVRSHYLEEKVKLLIAYGADLNIQNAEGLTALMLAARETRTQVIVRLLCDAKAHVNMTDHNGNTALMHVAMKGHRYVIGMDLYKRYGAKFHLRNKQGETFFDFVVASGERDMLDLARDFYVQEATRIGAVKKALYDECRGGLKTPIARKRFGGFKGHGK